MRIAGCDICSVHTSVSSVLFRALSEYMLRYIIGFGQLGDIHTINDCVITLNLQSYDFQSLCARS